MRSASIFFLFFLILNSKKYAAANSVVEVFNGVPKQRYFILSSIWNLTGAKHLAKKYNDAD